MKRITFYQCEVCCAFYDNANEATDCEAVPMPPQPGGLEVGRAYRVQGVRRVYKGPARMVNETGVGAHHWVLVFEPPLLHPDSVTEANYKDEVVEA